MGHNQNTLVGHCDLIQSSCSSLIFNFQKGWFCGLDSASDGVRRPLCWHPSLAIISSVLYRCRLARELGDKAEHMGHGLGSSVLILHQVS